MRSISRPKDRSAGRRGAGACAATFPSPPASIPASPTISALRIPLPGLAAPGLVDAARFHAPEPLRPGADAVDRPGTDARGFANAKAGHAASTTTLFRPGARDRFDLPRPIMLFAGRLAPEKNIEAFLSLDLPGTKVIVGDGPRPRRSADAISRRHFHRLSLRRRARAA